MSNILKLNSLYKVPFGVLPIVVIIWQLASSIGAFGFRITDYFSLFAILSNLFAGTVLILSAYKYNDKINSRIDYLRGMNTTYLIIVGIVYYALIERGGGYQYLTISNSNLILHRIMPLVLIIDFAIDRPVKKFEYKKTLLWLIFPIVFVAYSLIRGTIVNWYPYDFLDPNIVGGYLGVLKYSLAITAGFLFFGYGIYYICNTKRDIKIQ